MDEAILPPEFALEKWVEIMWLVMDCLRRLYTCTRIRSELKRVEAEAGGPRKKLGEERWLPVGAEQRGDAQRTGSP
jgi:hypothetical protein